MKIGVDEALGVRGPVFWVVPIDVVAPKRWDFASLVHLRWARPGFRKLPRHSGDTQNRLVGAPDEDKAHLQEQLDF